MYFGGNTSPLNNIYGVTIQDFRPSAPMYETGESAARGRKSYYYVYFNADTW
jgi:hypothetical protein